MTLRNSIEIFPGSIPLELYHIPAASQVSRRKPPFGPHLEPQSEPDRDQIFVIRR